MGNKQDKYILLISVHGLIRSRDMELGRDADTGGQTKYVIDLARALAEQKGIDRVDLVTRRIVDKTLSSDYSEPVEALSDRANIIRIDAGPEEYIPKEKLWDHLDIFTDNMIQWLQERDRLPDIVHSHYADAGYVGVRLSNFLGVPLVHTGHSLGRDKRKRLLAKGIDSSEIDDTYNMARRIDAEEEVLANAALVITSTQNEVSEQYGLYSYYNAERMTVIPPGTDLAQFYPPGKAEECPFHGQLEQFLSDPDKPLILALSRPDERKNILKLIDVFGHSEALQACSNLLVVAGNREDIRDLEPGARHVLTNILILIDAHNLYGKVAVPKQHAADDVAAIYRKVAASSGVFINPALTEPFGLTLLEATASGIPIVATENGGPVDIIQNCRNGDLVDPLDNEQIEAALIRSLTDTSLREQRIEAGLQGVREHYSWQAHTEEYIEAIDELEFTPALDKDVVPLPRTVRYRDCAVFTDLDQNLLGDPESLHRFAKYIQQNRKTITFGVATGRRIESALAIIKKYGVPRPDVLITGLGSRIHYGQSLIEDDYWSDHVDHEWTRYRIQKLLSSVPGLKLQPRQEQGAFKISWYYDQEEAPTIDEIVTLLREKEITANVTSSFGQFLDITPSRVSKGQALRYVAHRLEIPMDNILVAGGSGADEDMMRGNAMSVVVSNRHHEELALLEDVEGVYYATNPHAAGIIEAIEHYDFPNHRRNATDS